MEKVIEECPGVNYEVEDEGKRYVIEENDTNINDEDEGSTEVE